MYGFPLTVYLLVRFVDLDGSELSANLWSSLLGFGEMGMLISMLLGYALAVIGIGLFLQGWRELHRAHQQNRLAKDGLYGLVRHPQYTGLFLILFGEGIVHWPTLFSVSLFPIIVLAYSCSHGTKSDRSLSGLVRSTEPISRQCQGLFREWAGLQSSSSGPAQVWARLRSLSRG